MNRSVVGWFGVLMLMFVTACQAPPPSLIRSGSLASQSNVERKNSHYNYVSSDKPFVDGRGRRIENPFLRKPEPLGSQNFKTLQLNSPELDAQIAACTTPDSQGH